MAQEFYLSDLWSLPSGRPTHRKAVRRSCRRADHPRTSPSCSWPRSYASRDPLRSKSDFSEDIQQVNAVLHNPKVKKLSKITAYREWLRKNQPCVFGRAAATNRQVFICMLEEQQILTMRRGDDDLSDTIHDHQKVWSCRGFMV